MIIRLLPNQVSGLWSVIKTGIVDIGAKEFPGDWELSNNLFQRCLAGTVQVWLGAEEGTPKAVFKGFWLTAVETDNLNGDRTLALLMIYFYKEPSLELLKEGVAAVREYARSNTCRNITLITPPGHREKLVEAAWGTLQKKTLYVIPVR